MSNLNHLERPISEALFAEAKQYFPGGVSSPVRAFKSVGGAPLFIKKGKGARIWDEDGHEFIDFCGSWGPLILGHRPAEVEAAIIEAVQNGTSFGTPTRAEMECGKIIIENNRFIEKLRFVSSGTEAVMSALRLARGATGRTKIIKFEGCYHGHGDSFLIAAGSGAVTMGVPDSPGVTKGVANDTLTAPFNDLVALEQLIDANRGQIAALILEPVVGNMGCVLPKEGYLEAIRTLCTKEGIVLIFDEVMTGFRLAKGGAQERFGIVPDMTTMGKIIGGGMPVGAYGGKREIMDCVSPAGPVYQAGTLSGNPIAMSAGLAMLRYLEAHPEVYTRLDEVGNTIAAGFKASLQKLGLNYTINHIGSMFTLFMTDQPVTDFNSAKAADLPLFGRYFQAMLKRGIYLAPSQFESLFFSYALEDAHIQQLIETNEEALREVI